MSWKPPPSPPPSSRAFGPRAADGRRLVIGMVHLEPLPGTPFHEEGSLDATRRRAVDSALALRNAGADGCLVQTADRTYDASGACDPARIAAMALVVEAVVRATGSADFSVGAQMMRNAAQASLAVAKVGGARYVRVDALVGATMSASGLLQSDAHGTAEYRRKIAAQGVGIVADIHSMQFRWHGSERPVGEIANLALQAGADALALGAPAVDQTQSLIRAVRAAAPSAAIWLAGYTTHDNVQAMMIEADGAFVGSCLERGGWGGRIDEQRAADFVRLVRALPPRTEAGGEP